MSAKILISGLANTGKTSLLRDLEDAYIISRDGKRFSLPLAHTNFTDFNGIDAMINGYEDEDGDHVPGINDKIMAYHATKGVYPKTVVWDSVSKILQDIIDLSTLRFTNFDIHTNINKEVALLTQYIEEHLIASGMNVVLLSHAMYDDKSGNYTMVGQGKFHQKGGFLAEVDHAVFVELKGKKRIVHHKSPKLASRSLLPELPDSQPVADINAEITDEDYSLQRHIDMINSHGNEVAALEI